MIKMIVLASAKHRLRGPRTSPLGVQTPATTLSSARARARHRTFLGGCEGPAPCAIAPTCRIGNTSVLNL